MLCHWNVCKNITESQTSLCELTGLWQPANQVLVCVNIHERVYRRVVTYTTYRGAAEQNQKSGVYALTGHNKKKVDLGSLDQ